MGEQVTHLNGSNNSLLYEALERRLDVAVVQALIKAGADVRERVTHLNGSQQSLREVAIDSRFPQAIIDHFPA